ncbi:MAG: hypothetical protein AAF645_25615, partial [Myxococcota bacterium]
DDATTDATVEMAMEASVDERVAEDAATGEDAAGEAGLEDEGVADAEVDAPTGPPVPVLPEIMGDCPDYAEGTITVMGLDVEVRRGAPSDVPGPLVITWHGTGGTGNQSIRQLTNPVEAAILAEGGMILAPNDDGEERVGRSPNGVWYESSDLQVADQLVACAVRDANIDPARIYVTGCSAGGLMAGAMTGLRSGYVAASYLDSGGLLFPAPFETAYTPSILTMHGGPDDIVIVSFQTLSLRIARQVAAAGGSAIDCNHLSGHCGAPSDLRMAGWDFVRVHRYGEPSPFPDGPDESFPEYCAVPDPE